MERGGEQRHGNTGRRVQLPPPAFLALKALSAHLWLEEKSSFSSIAAAAEIKLTNHLLQPVETQQSYLETQRLLTLMLYSVLTFLPRDLSDGV